MSRYYFHFVNGNHFVQDSIGVDLTETELISIVSQGLLAKIEAEDPDLLAPWEGWRLHVTDADGSVITAVTI